MDLKEIVYRDFNEPINEDEIRFLFREYIKMRKNVNINPIIMFDGFFPHLTISLMHEMINHMVIWFREQKI